MQKRFFVPTQNTDSWKEFLADPEKQWKVGFSARTMAYSWEEAQDFPEEVLHIFECSEILAFKQLEMLLAIPEYQVDLPGGSRPSQNDLFVLAKDCEGELVSITVEGKVREAFGQKLGAWTKSSSAGKRERLAFLKRKLKLSKIPNSIRYQLLHRSVSAIFEEERYNAKCAVMLVHSFSQDMLWFDDFKKFLALYGIEAEAGKLHFLRKLSGIKFYAAWAKGHPSFLER